METSGFDLLVEINETLINRALAVAYYTSAVPTFVDGTYAPTEKLPPELKKYAQIDFTIHLREPPTVDAISKPPSDNANQEAVVRLIFNIDFFLKLFGGLESRFDITTSIDAAVDLQGDQNRILLDLLHGQIDLIRINNETDFPANVLKIANQLINDVLKTHLLDKIKSIDMAPFLKPVDIPDPVEGIDAVVMWNNGKAYFFKGAYYISYDIAANKADDGYPHSIAADWPGLWSEGIDAAIAWPNGKAYFFKEGQYLRYDIATKQPDPGHPRNIKDDWPGLWPDGIDAAVAWPNGKTNFFKKDEYILYDNAANRALDGYPLQITHGWAGLWGDGVDAAVVWPNNKIYFFKGDQYLSYDYATGTTDAGFPRKTKDGWPGVWAGKLSLPVKPGGFKTINEQIFAAGVNLFNNPAGDISIVQDFTAGYDLWLGVPQKAMHQIFDFAWLNTAHHLKRMRWVETYNVMDNAKMRSFVNTMSTVFAHVLPELLTGGFLNEDITVNYLRFDASATLSVEKPNFDLQSVNTIDVSNLRADIGLYLKCTTSITSTTKINLVPGLDFTGVEVSEKTAVITLFEFDQTFTEAVTDVAAVLTVDLQKGIYAKVLNVKLSIDLGITLLDEVVTWLTNQLVAMVIQAMPPMRILPSLIKETIDPKDLDLSLQSGDLTADVEDDVLQHPLTVQVQAGPIMIDQDEFTAAINLTIVQMGRMVLPVPKFIANANPKRMEVHRLSCTWVDRIDESYKRGYYVLVDALHDGYDGCKFCLPEYNTR